MSPLQDRINDACAASLAVQVKHHTLQVNLQSIISNTVINKPAATRLLEMARVINRTLKEIDRELAESFHNED